MMINSTMIRYVKANRARPLLHIIICLMLGYLFLGAMALSVMAAPLIHRIGAPLSHPWGMDFLDDRHLFVTERSGNLYLVDIMTGARQSLGNLPEIVASNQGGMLDVAVHRDPHNSDDTITLYLCYSRPSGEGSITAIDMAGFNGSALTNRKTIFKANNMNNGGLHYGCRLALDKTYLYASLGERGERHDAQNPALHAGAVIRLLHDGSIPQDNPKFSGKAEMAGWAPEIFTKGHRNPQGMAIRPETGALWVHEHGPRGGDEINIIQPGANYGWPEVSHGREYSGPSIGIGNSAPGLIDPVWVWTPSIAPSGMAFYKGAMFDYMNGHLLVGSLKFKRLYLVIIKDGKPVRESIMLDSTIGRIRDVAVSFDGSILLLSDEDEGGLFRIAEAGQ